MLPHESRGMTRASARGRGKEDGDVKRVLKTVIATVITAVTIQPP